MDCASTTNCPAAAAVAKEAVRQTFAILGVDVDEPKEVEEFRRDLRFGQSMRKMAERGQIAMVTVLVGGLMAAVWAGVKVNFSRFP